MQNDPVNYVDWLGLENLKPVSLVMQADPWGNSVLGNASNPKINLEDEKDRNYLVREEGCYLTGYLAYY